MTRTRLHTSLFGSSRGFDPAGGADRGTSLFDRQPARALSHLVIGTPEQSFIAIEDDELRLPIDGMRVDGSAIRWLRADGSPESIDLKDCESKDRLLEQFLSPEGVLIALFPSLDNPGLDDPKFLVVATHGYTEVSPLGPEDSSGEGTELLRGGA